MKKLFMITLLITSVYLLLNTEEPIEILPRIAEKQENIPLLVKPNISYKTEVSPWDKMFSRVKHYESFKSEAYRCSGGVMTIGYGHTKNVKWGDTITEAEALKLRMTAIDKSNAVIEFCPDGHIISVNRNFMNVFSYGNDIYTLQCN